MPAVHDEPVFAHEALEGTVPASAPAVDNTGFATAHGKLRLDGVQLVDAQGAAVQLMGMSSHGTCFVFPLLCCKRFGGVHGC